MHRRVGQRRAVLRDVLRRGPHRSATSAAARELSEASRARAGDSLIDTLARLHAVDVDAVGLGTSPGGTATSPGSSSGGTASSPSRRSTAGPGPAVVDRVHELLAARIPEQQGVAIVHGDYRLDNTVLDDDGDGAWPSSTGRSARSVTRWPTSGLLLVYWAEPEDGDQALLGVAPTALPGSPAGPTCWSATPRLSGRDVSHIAYYRAFGFWKLACILQGVHVRYAGGAAAGDRTGVDQFAAHVGRLGERALAEVESL